MEKFNISVPQKYMSQGVEKTFWTNVGTLTVFKKQDGSVSRLVEIPAIGLKANAFPIQPKNIQNTQTITNRQDSLEQLNSIDYPNEQINVEDIPF